MNVLPHLRVVSFAMGLVAAIAQCIYNSTMRYELQRRIQRELDTRIPRWLKGSPQNSFRQAVYFFRSQGLSFEESLEKAAEFTRRLEPDFSPTVLPPSRS